MSEPNVPRRSDPPEAPVADDLPTSNKLDRRVLVIGSVVVLGAIMAMLDITIVNIAIQHLSVEFGSPLETIQWVATGYTLALATVIPLSGWAADRFGPKRIYLTAIALFLAGSALAGTAWSTESLILFRVLQGLGGGMLMPLGMTILTRAAGPQRVGRVMAVLGVPMLLGPIIGPILGGWLVEDVSWRWIFYINIPIGALVLLLGSRLLDRDEPQPSQRLDIIGVLLLSPGLAALIYGLAQIPEKGTVNDSAVYLPGAIGAVLILAFLVHAGRIRYALIDLKLFKDRAFAVAAGTMILFTVAFFGSMLLFPLYFQQVRLEGPLAAGLLLAPQGIGAMIMMPIAGTVADRFGSARIVQLGILVVIAGMVVFTQLGADTSYWTIGAALFVLGLGMGMSMMPIMAAALRTLRKSDVAKASTSLNIIQQVGASIGTATLAVILSSTMTDKFTELFGRLGVPPGQIDSGSGADMANLPPELAGPVFDTLADSFSSTFVWALVLLGVALLPALLLPRGKGGRPDGDADDDTQEEPVPVHGMV